MSDRHVDHLNKSWVKYEWRNFHNDMPSKRKAEDAPFFALVSGPDPQGLPRPLRQQSAVRIDQRGLDAALAEAARRLPRPPKALWRKRSALTRVLRVGVTGHRILAEEDKLERGVDRVLRRIAQKFPDRPLGLVSPLAEGADRLVARRLLTLPGARLDVPLPMPRAEYIRDFEWGRRTRQQRSKEEFQSLLDRADRVFELPAAATRDEAYEQVGRYVLDHCDVLIAVWDGKGAQGKGGTGGVVAQARRRRLPIAWIRAGNRKAGSTDATSLGAKQGTVTFERFV